MKINKKKLPLKAHYFFFLGASSPVIPFLIVIGRQLGIPVIYTGVINGALLIFTILFKPLIGSLADAFPKARKAIFITIISLMVIGFTSIAFVPSINGDNLEVNGFLTQLEVEGLNMSFLMSNKSGCFINEAWDCSNKPSTDGSCVGSVKKITLNESLSYINEDNVYELMNYKDLYNSTDSFVRFYCKGGTFIGDSCKSLWTNGAFWLFFLMFALGSLCYTMTNSISDAICIDIVGVGGDYGNERAWGTVGWGIMGPIAGALTDWYSGSCFIKNYIPAFMIVLIYGICDVIVATLTLRVPRFKADEGVWKTVGPVFKNTEFLLFAVFVVLNGSFDGIVLTYLFVLQEEIAKGTSYMQYMKFIQGITILIQCSLEAPMMWSCDWIMKKIGARRVTSLVFFLYSFRLFALAFAGYFESIWATLVIEFLNGPCYGLGYTAIVVQAGLKSLPGTSATIQSIINICYESFGYALAAAFGGILNSFLGSSGVYFVFGGVAIIAFILHFGVGFCFKTEEGSNSSSSKNATSSPIEESNDESSRLRTESQNC